MTRCMQPGLHVSELHKLTALTHVHLSYYDEDIVDSFDECVRGLSALTHCVSGCTHWRLLQIFQK
jgi:hypothetical protein